MKRISCLLIIVVMVLLNQPTRLARAETFRKITVMVYMCGSNLESGYGSASADLQEMFKSGFDSNQVTLLVMTGGTEAWSLGFDPASLAIQEVGRRGTRIVWQQEASSMGAPETLTTLLNYGVERYPAEVYALILWDHGGGPMEGLCWDELFSMDNLSLSELTQALKASRLPGRLSWIGFDACLMCSAEVAMALAPYADYMIASQETEPACGWNYAFLNQLGNDTNAEETGCRIVDAYFEGAEGIPDTLTLACLDLSRISDVASAMDGFFQPVSDNLNADSFARLSGLRMAAVSFGKPVSSVGDDGYDLVDIGSLAQEYSKDPQLADRAETLASALSEAVVYCRSSEEGAGGLSIYHPYANKKKYTERWGSDYRKLSFSTGYRSYMNRFGALLTGETIADWSGLSAPEEREGVFSLQLNAEQAANFSSGRLLILGAFNNSVNRVSYTPIYSSEATLDDNGMLTAAYNGRSLYLADMDGEPINGPIGVLPGNEPGRYYILAHYWSSIYPASAVRDEIVIYQFDESTDDSGLVETLVPRIWDEVSQTYTNRIPFEENEFACVGFKWDLRYKPDGEGTMPGFEEWETIDGGQYASLYLPQPWQLRFVDDQLTGTQLYATFQITDAQQNLYCTPLVSIDNDNLASISLSPSIFEDDSVRLELSAETAISSLECGMNLKWRITNLTDADIEFHATPIILNGRRRIDESISTGYFKISSGETVEGVTAVPMTSLRELESVESIQFDVSLYYAGSYHTFDDLSVQADVNDFDAGALALTAAQSSRGQSICSQTIETNCGRVRMTLEPDSDGLNMFMFAENTSDKTCDFTISDFYLGRRQFNMYWSFDDLEPGIEAMRSEYIHRNDNYLYGLEEIRDIRCELSVDNSETWERLEKTSMSFELEGLDVSGLAPTFYTDLGEVEAGGIRWELLSLQEKENDRIRGVVNVTNMREEPLDDVDVTIAANGITIFDGIFGRLNLIPGTDQILVFDTHYIFHQTLSDIGFVSGEYRFNFEDYLSLDHLLNRHGIEQITSLTFAPAAEDLSDTCVTLELKEPLALQGGTEGQTMPKSAAILEGPVRAELYAVAAGSKGIGLSVELANDTDRVVWLHLRNPFVGQQGVEFDYGNDVYMLPPHTVLDTALCVDTAGKLEEGFSIQEFSFEFDYGCGIGTVSIGGLDEAREAGQSNLLTADLLEISPARIDASSGTMDPAGEAGEEGD